MIEKLAHSWHSLIVRGTIVILLGIGALSFPSDTLWAIEGFAVYAMLHGLVEIAGATRARDSGHGVILLTGGLVWIVSGIATLVWLGHAIPLGYIVALWALGIGLVSMSVAVVGRDFVPHKWLLALYGLVVFILGAWLITQPRLYLVQPTLELGLLLLITGFAMLSFGLQTRHAERAGSLAVSGDPDKLVGL
jgi:uncharacterized membrane protein HdeD (DUF308 family)